MDKHIKIEWPYKKITLDFSEVAKCPILSEQQWETLAQEEHRLYRGTGAPTYGYTGVMEREDMPMIAMIWMDCETSLENNDEDWNRLDRPQKNRRIAKRVARVLAVITYGPEYLLI